MGQEPVFSEAGLTQDDRTHTEMPVRPAAFQTVGVACPLEETTGDTETNAQDTHRTSEGLSRQHGADDEELGMEDPGSNGLSPAEEEEQQAQGEQEPHEDENFESLRKFPCPYGTFV